MIHDEIRKHFEGYPEIQQIVDMQHSKGISTYGKPLDKNNAPVKERVNHAIEGIVDAMKYARWLAETQEGLNRTIVETEIKSLSSIAVSFHRIGKGEF